MSLTITIPGAVEATIGATAPAVLTIGVGTPGATGPAGAAGAAGVGVPVGGTAGQFLTKIDGTNYNTDWTTLPAYLLSSTAASTYQTLAGMSSYLTTATAASTYAVIAAGQPTSGTVGQVLTKNSGTNYDSSWATLIPGDRYLTSSTTSLTINNTNKTLTIGTGLSYTPEQDVIIAYDAAHHMHARVTTYNSTTGVMDVDVISHTGTGTYASWTVNVGGTVPVASIVWGDITGTLGNQTDLATALNSKLELSGGVLDVNATIDASTATTSSTFGGDVFGVQLSANPSENASLQYSGLQVQNAIGTMSVTPSGLTFPNASSQTVAYPGSTGFLLKADNLSGLADTAVSRTNLGLGTMATASASNYSTTTVANGLYYPLSGNPSSFLVAADISGKANLASPALTGNVTITSNSASPALTITQDGAGDIVQFKDVASDTTYTFIDQNGKVNTIPAVTTGAGFNIPNGVAPTSNLVNGDFWTTTSGVFTRINGNSLQLADTASGLTYSGSNTFSAANLTFGSSTAASTINIGTGATLTATTKAINIGTAGVAGSTTNIIVGPVLGASTTSIGNTTAASTLNLATGATLTATTKAVNIGTNGVAGSTTNIAIGSTTGTSTTTFNGSNTFGGPITAAINNVTLGSGAGDSALAFATGATASGLTKAVTIGTGGLAGSTTNITIGSTTGTSTTTLQGNTNSVTQTAGNSTTLLATTAFVTTADNLKANLASPSLTGTPLSTTAAVDTNTTQIATTAFVVAQAGSATPAALGTAAVGTSLRYARADHVHPTAFAATSDVNGPSSTTLTTSPKNVVDMLLHAGYNLFYQGAGSTSTSGAGSAIYGYGGRWKEYVSPNAGTAGYALGVYDTEQVSYGYTAYSRSAAISLHDWTKKIWISGRCMIGHPTISTTYDGDANTFARISLGGYTAFGAGDMSSAQRGVGFKVAGGGSAAMQLVVTNGTTVTSVTSSFTPTLRQVFDWKIYSDGAGNVTLFINDSQVATTTAGPSTTGSFGLYMEGVDTTASSTRALIMENFGTKIYHGV